jgi:hypothetical protein
MKKFIPIVLIAILMTTFASGCFDNDQQQVPPNGTVVNNYHSGGDSDFWFYMWMSNSWNHYVYVPYQNHVVAPYHNSVTYVQKNIHKSSPSANSVKSTQSVTRTDKFSTTKLNQPSKPVSRQSITSTKTQTSRPNTFSYRSSSSPTRMSSTPMRSSPSSFRR